jgi:hypothetical protein
MTQYLLAVCKARDDELSGEQTRQVRADVNALGARLKDASRER